jgi:hypothetical protein
MSVRQDFDAPFEVKIHERAAWDNVPTEQDALTYYTDGSRKNGLEGMGIYGPCLRHFEVLGVLSRGH